MAHLYLLILIFSIMIALVTAGVYIFLYQKYRLELIRYYLYNLTATIIMVFFVALNFYIYLNLGVFDNMMKIMFGYSSSILLFSAPLIFTTPMFARALIGRDNSKKIKSVFAVMAVLVAIIGILVFFEGYLNLLPTMTDIARTRIWLFLVIWLGILLIFISTSYSFMLIFRNFRKVNDPVQKLGSKLMVLFGILSSVLVYFDFETQKHQLESGQYPVGIFLQPLNLFLFSAMSIIVLLYAKKKHAQKSQSIPQGFILKYKITDREIEIIEMIYSGLSNKEIASKLFLSPSTVRNHISNIFEKTGTPTRGKLTNLMKQFH